MSEILSVVRHSFPGVWKQLLSASSVQIFTFILIWILATCDWPSPSLACPLTSSNVHYTAVSVLFCFWKHPMYCNFCQTTSPDIQTQRNSLLWPIPASTLLFSRLHIKAECVKQLAGACCRLYLEQPSGPGPPLFWAWWGGNPARLRRVLIITLHLRQAAQPRAEPGWRRAADWQDKKMPQRRGRDL